MQELPRPVPILYQVPAAFQLSRRAGGLLRMQKRAGRSHHVPGHCRENPTTVHTTGTPAGVAEETGPVARLTLRHSRNADGISHHGTEQDHPDDHHGSEPLCFMQGPAERHEFDRQGITEVVEHCD